MVTDSDTIHADGSVELMQRWRPGGAKNADVSALSEDATYLMAILTADDEWEFVTAGVLFTPHGMELLGPTGRPVDDWNWNDVEWFVPCDDVDLPRM